MSDRHHTLPGRWKQMSVRIIVEINKVNQNVIKTNKSLTFNKVRSHKNMTIYVYQYW